MASEALKKIKRGLEILEPIAVGCEAVPVPRSFSNGAPDFSSSAYIAVEVEGDLASKELEELKSLGWSDEWPHFAFYGH
jgi:hypothetical protein